MATTKDRLKARLRPVLDEWLYIYRIDCQSAAFSLDAFLRNGGDFAECKKAQGTARNTADDLLEAVFRVIDQVVDDD